MRSGITDALGISMPLLAAPMAGGPGSPALVRAAASAGGLGFLAAGYKTPQALAEEIATVREGSRPFGVNLFAPNLLLAEVEPFRRYAHAIQVEADRYGIELAGSEPVDDDDHWRAKIDVLLADPVPVTGFTFGIPAPDIMAALRASGTFIVQTVTSSAEARAAEEAGAHALAVQATVAGGHSGTLTPLTAPPPVPLDALVAEVAAAVRLPLIAAGGLATADDVTRVLRGGASAAMVGTVLLRTDEAGTSATHRAALADPARTDGVITHAFTGRPARALRNEFTDRYADVAPYGYPALHHLTSPLRKAAAAAGDPERVHLWAGAGWRHAREEPAAAALARLASQI